MNPIVNKLFYLSEELDENKFLHESDCQAAHKLLNKLLDKVEEATSASFHAALYDAIWESVNAEQLRAFHMGLRLGLQLHAL